MTATPLGTKVVLPFTVSDTSLPVVYNDPLLIDGTMMLIDWTHPYNPAPSGVVAPPNIASARALNMGIGATATDVAPPLAINGNLSGPNGKVERTTLGGLHGILAQTSGNGSLSGASMQSGIPLALMNYILANPNHSYYVSLWKRITRAGASSVTGFKPFSGFTGGNTAKYEYVFQDTTDVPTGAAQIGGRSTNPGALGYGFHDIGVSAGTGTAPVISSTTGAPMLNWGINLTYATGRSGTMPSWVNYRYVLHDLTVSGQTYAALDALEYALYQKECLTTGGRYYGDTIPTDPATVYP